MFGQHIYQYKYISIQTYFNTNIYQYKHISLQIYFLIINVHYDLFINLHKPKSLYARAFFEFKFSFRKYKRHNIKKI